MKKNINMVKAYRNSKFGRAVARLLGEETGAVMMEYVVVAVVIAAACALIMAIWGKSIFGQANTAILATDGRHDGAKTAQEAVRTDNDNGVADAVTHQNTFSDNDNQSATQYGSAGK